MNMQDGLGSPSNLNANGLHRNGLTWPTQLSTQPTALINSLYTIGRFNNDSNNPTHSSLQQCKALLKTGQLFLAIWGNKGITPTNQHIAPGYFIDPAKTQIEIHEGNADNKGAVKSRTISTSTATLTYCLVPKQSKFPQL
jgi:hypothetical protein